LALCAEEPGESSQGERGQHRQPRLSRSESARAGLGVKPLVDGRAVCHDSRFFSTGRNTAITDVRICSRHSIVSAMANKHMEAAMLIRSFVRLTTATIVVVAALLFAGPFILALIAPFVTR
jgi:hypothetical protein